MSSFEMSGKEHAAVLDEQDRPLDATQAYEAAIREPSADLETYLNLAVLCFVSTDFGYAAHHGLSKEFVDSAWKRANELLLEAEGRFGKNPEVDFWRRYFGFVVLGDKPFFQEALGLAQGGSSLVPYFYLFTATAGERFRQEAERLLDMVRDGSTAKKRYIRSILERRVQKAIKT